MDRGFDSPNLQVTDGRNDVVNSNFQFHYGSSLSSAVARMAEFKELVLSEEANIDFGTTARTSTTTFASSSSTISRTRSRGPASSALRWKRTL